MVILAAFAVTANAKFSYGVKAGMNATHLRFDSETITGKNGCGWFIGPTAQLTFPLGIVNIGADASLLYDYRHSTAESNGVSESIKQHSILIPLNARAKFSLLKMLGAYFATGPQFGFNVGKNSLDFTSPSSIKDHFQLKKSQFSWNIGLGLILMNHLEVGATYNIGIGKTGELKGMSETDVLFTPKQNMWTISAAYYF